MGLCQSKDEFNPSNIAPPPGPQHQQQTVVRNRNGNEDRSHRAANQNRSNSTSQVKENDRNGMRNGHHYHYKTSKGSNHSSSSTTTVAMATEPRPRHQRRNRSTPSSGGATGMDNKDTNNYVHFPDFKDREKNSVDSILETNRHLEMAKINFKELKLQKIIGTGAFGEVIKGTYCGTPVVVKRMLRSKIDENNLRMFGEEIQLMMNLRHPNIVQFIGASWNSYSNVCFVTEFLERGDLFSVLRNPKYILSWADPLLRMMIDASRGMAYLHSMTPPIIHRDLKSMNILVSSTFGCKISDFGLSREKSVDETMSVTGTPLWLPPEMIRGERYTEKADVYSFGIVISEVDTRKIPYHDIKAKGARNKKVSGSTLMHMVAYQHLRPSLSPNCLSTVKRLFERCTADQEDARPTFEEIVSELDETVRFEVYRKKMQDEEKSAEEKKESLALSQRYVGDDDDLSELGVKHATKYNDDTPTNSFGYET